MGKNGNISVSAFELNLEEELEFAADRPELLALQTPCYFGSETISYHNNDIHSFPIVRTIGTRK